jgi:hypothetical protein
MPRNTWSVGISGVEERSHAATGTVRIRRFIEPVVDKVVAKISTTGFAGSTKALTRHVSLSI